MNPGKTLTYLDYAATAPPQLCSEKMLEIVNFELRERLVASYPGHHASSIIEEARAEVAKLINADPSEIIFSSGGSESNNTVANIFAGKKVATSAVEHPSVLESLKATAPALRNCKVDRCGFC